MDEGMNKAIRNVMERSTLKMGEKIVRLERREREREREREEEEKKLWTNIIEQENIRYTLVPKGERIQCK